VAATANPARKFTAVPASLVSLKFDFIAPGRVPLMWCLIAFIVTFFVTRTIVRYIRATAHSDKPKKWYQPRNMSVGGSNGFHLHHVVIGVVLVLLSGVIMVTLAVDGGVTEFTVTAVFFGIGAALVLDEFALILHLQDVYWQEQGRISIDAIFVAVAMTGLLLLGLRPIVFSDLIDARQQGLSYALALTFGALQAALAAITLLKGKIWTGLVGLFVPFLLFMGAIRLARPDSPWARGRYKDTPRRLASLEKAKRREERFRRPIIRAKIRFQELLAGRPDKP